MGKIALRSLEEGDSVYRYDEVSCDADSLEVVSSFDDIDTSSDTSRMVRRVELSDGSTETFPHATSAHRALIGGVVFTTDEEEYLTSIREMEKRIMGNVMKLHNENKKLKDWLEETRSVGVFNKD